MIVGHFFGGFCDGGVFFDCEEPVRSFCDILNVFDRWGQHIFFAFQTAGLGQWFLSDKKLPLVTEKSVARRFFEEKGGVISGIAEVF
jgi:hypothetical protein